MKIFLLILPFLIIASCDSAPVKTQIANPASVKCIEDGYRLEIRKSEDGGEYGVCIDADKGECEEWKYFRGECRLGRKISET
jgi:putative hemolysin